MRDRKGGDGPADLPPDGSPPGGRGASTSERAVRQAGGRQVAGVPGSTNSVQTTSAEYRVGGRSAGGTVGHETIPSNATTAVFDNDDA